MQIHPHLNFNGQCEAAFKFYAKCLGGKIEAMIPYEGTPAAGHAPSEWQKKILHASLKAGEGILLGADIPPGEYKKPEGFAVTLQIKDPAEAERVFHALGEKGKVGMPIGETFWAVKFGMLVDQFGIHWMVNCGKMQT
jgi:PhnB protein